MSQSSSLTQMVLQVQSQHLSLSDPDLLRCGVTPAGEEVVGEGWGTA